MSLIKNDEPIKPKADPSARPDHTIFLVGALRAVRDGRANQRQQQAAMDFIINGICGTYDQAFRPGSNDRSTTFALGKQFVGQSIIFFLNTEVTKSSLDKMSLREEQGAEPHVDEK
jgi:hypothetical protein